MYAFGGFFSPFAFLGFVEEDEAPVFCFVGIGELTDGFISCSGGELGGAGAPYNSPS